MLYFRIIVHQKYDKYEFINMKLNKLINKYSYLLNIIRIIFDQSMK